MTVWELHPEKFQAVHQRLMSKKGPHDEASAVEAVKSVGLAPITVTPASYLELKTNVEIAEVLVFRAHQPPLLAISWWPGRSAGTISINCMSMAKVKHDSLNAGRASCILVLIIVAVMFAMDFLRGPQAPANFGSQPLQLLEGQKITLLEQSQQRPLLVYFWATWCGYAK